MEKKEIKNKKLQSVFGVLEIPDSEVVGTVVIQHGYGGTKDQDHIQKIKKAFLDNGFITFNFDATNSFGESDGKYEDATMALHYDDFEYVTNWVQEQEWFVPPLAVTGHSLGGYSAARYAEEYPNKVGLCAPIAPLVSGRLSFDAYEEFLPEEFKKWKKDGFLEKPHKSVPGKVKHSPWSHMEERLNHDLLKKVDNLTMPVFLYVGSKDTSIPSKHIQILYDAIPGGNKKMVVAEGAPHTYRTDEDLENLYKEIDIWLKDTLTKNNSDIIKS